MLCLFKNSHYLIVVLKMILNLGTGSTSVGLTVGLVVAGGAVLAGATVLIVFLIRRKKYERILSSHCSLF